MARIGEASGYGCQQPGCHRTDTFTVPYEDGWKVSCPDHSRDLALFPHRICSHCGWDAGPGNGWFGNDPRCLDCREDARRAC